MWAKIFFLNLAAECSLIFGLFHCHVGENIF